MDWRRRTRFFVIAVLLLLGAWWTLASADRGMASFGYPGGRFMATAEWLAAHRNDPHLVVVDVRDDKYYDGRMIPGAVRMPWSLFRFDDTAEGIGGAFVGAVQAQEILGRHGISRDDEVVLYDSVERDGGATASYVFWVLDLLGHRKMRILDRGIDAWAEAGHKVANVARQAEPLLYQAPADEIATFRQVDGAFIYRRLGDPYYQILDVRSRAEYLGEAPSKALDGSPLKAGHIPGAVNREYRMNWVDPQGKSVKNYGSLQDLYRGLHPDKAVITYCHSARRGSYTYYILRLMGLKDVRLYDHSWYEWGSEKRYFPAEIRTFEWIGKQRPQAGADRESRLPAQVTEEGAQAPAEQPDDGYISCGG